MKGTGGFTLFELIIVIVLIGLLFATAWWRLMPLRGDAEAAHVKTTIGTLRSALGLEVSERLVKRQAEHASLLNGSNPMHLLASVPGNYLGEFEAIDRVDIPPGNWYFLSATGQLRYRVRFPRYLLPEGLEPPVDLAWKIRLRFHDNNENGRFDAATDVMKHIELEALHHATWARPEANAPELLEST